MDQVSFLSGFHRSGWSFVLKQLNKLQNDQGIWCDTYVDRTFHWLKPDFLPYSRPWIGFVHHTFYKDFSDYNNSNLLQNPLFLDSLPQCKGLYVFSEDQRQQWQRELQKRGITVPVEKISHPTQFVDNKFTMEKFKANPRKKLIQVGAWLRDNYAIYRVNYDSAILRLEDDSIVRKAALIGPQMSTYFKPPNFFRFFRQTRWKRPVIAPPIMDTVIYRTDVPAPTPSSSLTVNGSLPQDIISQIRESQDGDDGMCRDIVCRDSDYGLNKYVQGCIDMLKSYDNSVILIPTVSDSEYDALLSQNIVFLKLWDAAAVNTLIECVVRNTPVVVNPLPAVQEVLGANYPLYYYNLKDVPSLLSLANIQKAYDYLSSMDKTFLTANYFLQSLETSNIYNSLNV